VNKRDPSRSDTGAACELVIAADLIRKGFYVYRNLSPNGPSDLVALWDSRVFRIQVKTHFYRAAMQNNDVVAVHNWQGIRYVAPIDAEALFQISDEQKKRWCPEPVKTGYRCNKLARQGNYCYTHCYSHMPAQTDIDALVDRLKGAA
jgi:hypothetical protein